MRRQPGDYVSFTHHDSAARNQATGDETRGRGNREAKGRAPRARGRRGVAAALRARRRPPPDRAFRLRRHDLQPYLGASSGRAGAFPGEGGQRLHGAGHRLEPGEIRPRRPSGGRLRSQGEPGRDQPARRGAQGAARYRRGRAHALARESRRVRPEGGSAPHHAAGDALLQPHRVLPERGGRHHPRGHGAARAGARRQVDHDSREPRGPRVRHFARRGLHLPSLLRARLPRAGALGRRGAHHALAGSVRGAREEIRAHRPVQPREPRLGGGHGARREALPRSQGVAVMARKTNGRFDVGGVLLAQPFKIRRLGHFGLNVPDPAACLDFYCEGLGFRISDPLDVAEHHPRRDELKALGDTNMYFLRHGTDHHSFVLCNGTIYNAAGRGGDIPADVTVNQMTWQVSSLAEISGAIDWFDSKGVRISRAGRDMPGSNWHCYPYDIEGHRNELYYGMEQIGWTGLSKPRAMHERGFRERPPLPQMPEYEEVKQSAAKGVDFNSGFRHPEKMPAKYDVDGILLARPFKIVRHGPIRLFCRDLKKMEAFSTGVMGFTRTEALTWQGHRCVFLRCGTEHHSLALYPIALRKKLGLSPRTTVMSFGVQLATYRQLRAAIDFLKGRGGKFVEIPPALTPGIDYSAYVLDPAGHAIQLYYYMEQVGWNGRPRPQRGRVPARFSQWPDAVEPKSDTYTGEPYLGPWG